MCNFYLSLDPRVEVFFKVAEKFLALLPNWQDKTVSFPADAKNFKFIRKKKTRKGDKQDEKYLERFNINKKEERSNVQHMCPLLEWHCLSFLLFSNGSSPARHRQTEHEKQFSDSAQNSLFAIVKPSNERRLFSRK